MKIMDMLKEFGSTLVKYIDYLMKVDFKELFVNTVILLCLFVLAAFVYIPIGIVEDVLNTFIQFFVPISGIVGSIYSFIFKILSAVIAIFAFIYLFNKRFESLSDEVNNPKDAKKGKANNKSDNSAKGELDLPKEKDK